MNNSGYCDDDMCEGGMANYNDDIDNLVDNIGNLPQSQPNFTNDNRGDPRHNDPRHNDPRQMAQSNKRSKRFDPNAITDARQIPNAYISHSENSNGDQIPSIFIGNTSYPITSFMPSVINQIQARQNATQYDQAQYEQPVYPSYDEERLKIAQEKLALEREQLALERDRRMMMANTKGEKLIDLTDKDLVHSGNEHFANDQINQSLFAPLLTNWNKSLLVLALVVILMNPYTNYLVTSKIPYMSNAYLSFTFISVLIMVFYHVISGYILK